MKLLGDIRVLDLFGTRNREEWIALLEREAGIAAERIALLRQKEIV